MAVARVFSWVLASLLAIVIGLYPLNYLLGDANYRLLALKDKELLQSLFWTTSFYVHITTAGIALLVGWSQFYPKFRKRFRLFHKNIGKLYIVMAVCGALAGICLSFFANGGIIAKLGFFALGIVWFTTTRAAYTSIKKGNAVLHEQFMIYSYACCFAAVMLRLFLPFLMHYFDFDSSYQIVSWLCWVPNLLVATAIIHAKKTKISIA